MAQPNVNVDQVALQRDFSNLFSEPFSPLAGCLLDMQLLEKRSIFWMILFLVDL